MIKSQLIDQYGRRIRKLRVSLTDKCNLRCSYCMPVDAKFLDDRKLLTVEEYHNIVGDLCNYGLEEIRLTGGEPLMRREFDDIVAGLGKLPLQKIGMTTNGLFLARHLHALKESRVHHINLSLDSLNPETFRLVTHGGNLTKVLDNIALAKDAGFHLKINVVAMRGVNDHELFDFVKFAEREHIEVRFLELMRIGFACGNQSSRFISAAELQMELRKRMEISPLSSSTDSTAVRYQTALGGTIGFIASESQAFCGQCSRWRLSADGVLRACLMKEDGISIRGRDAEERAMIYHRLLGMKPGIRPVEVTHQMNTIGG